MDEHNEEQFRAHIAEVVAASEMDDTIVERALTLSELKELAVAMGLTEEEWECVRVCVSNAPIPYDITKKKIPAVILEKIGQPIKVKHEGIAKVKYDLTPYGIFD